MLSTRPDSRRNTKIRDTICSCQYFLQASQFAHQAIVWKNFAKKTDRNFENLSVMDKRVKKVLLYEKKKDDGKSGRSDIRRERME